MACHPGLTFVGKDKNNSMTTKKTDKKTDHPAPRPPKPDPASPAAAHAAADKDIEEDPDLSDPDPTDDLDEGELARRDNSDEDALDGLEKTRHKGGHASGSEK